VYVKLAAAVAVSVVAEHWQPAGKHLLLKMVVEALGL